MWNGDDLTTNIVIQAIDTIGVNETIANPFAGFYWFLDLTKDIKCVINTVFANTFFSLLSSGHRFAIEFQDKVGLFSANTNHISIFWPIHL